MNKRERSFETNFGTCVVCESFDCEVGSFLDCYSVDAEGEREHIGEIFNMDFDEIVNMDFDESTDEELAKVSEELYNER